MRKKCVKPKLHKLQGHIVEPAISLIFDLLLPFSSNFHSCKYILCLTLHSFFFLVHCLLVYTLQCTTNASLETLGIMKKVRRGGGGWEISPLYHPHWDSAPQFEINLGVF